MSDTAKGLTVLVIVIMALLTAAAEAFLPDQLSAGSYFEDVQPGVNAQQ